MSFIALRSSAAMVAMAALTLSTAAPASAQETYVRHHHRPVRHDEGRQIVVHAAPPPAPYGWGPGAAVGNVVGGTGQAVQSVFNGAGAVVGGVVGGVLGGATALVTSPSGYNNPGYAYAYGYGTGSPGYAPGNTAGGPIGAAFAAPFNAAGTVASAPFQVVGAAFGAGPAVR
jgi:hypothetical protein